MRILTDWLFLCCACCEGKAIFGNCQLTQSSFCANCPIDIIDCKLRSEELYLRCKQVWFEIYFSSTAASSVSVPEESRPRVCTVYKWSDFQGYGFQLNAGGDKPGNYIGEVDADSPASHAGLREGDRIVEVNDSFAYTDSHSAVVGLITSVPSQVKLLVVDKVADGMLDNNMTISQLGTPNYIEGPKERPGSSSVSAVSTSKL